jgi:hypothetical protein
VPNSVLAAAGLRPAFQDLTTSHPPVVALATPTCTDAVLVSGSGFTPDARASIGGRQLEPVTFIATNHLAVKLPQDSHGGAVSVTTRAGTSAANIDANSPLCSGLSTHFGNTGITDDNNTSPGNVDGFCYSFSGQALAAQGLVRGALIQSHGVSFNSGCLTSS